jgi:chromosome partitioning protein
MSNLSTKKFMAKNKSKTPNANTQQMRQIVLWIGANAGGVSKTTIAVHVGYEMARRGFDVVLLDLDTNGSMNLFCGLDRHPDSSNTMAAVLSDNFQGDWPLITPQWGNPKGKLQVCQGGPILSQVSEELATKVRREYVLADRLEDHPLPHQLIILDCPAMLGSLTNAALAASSHMLIPVQLSYKSIEGASGLLSWHRVTCKTLRLNPVPQILGVVPTQYDSSEAAQRRILAELPEQLEQIKIPCYKQIRYSSEFNNASGKGLPLHVYRSGHDACSDFQDICDDLSNLICEV